MDIGEVYCAMRAGSRVIVSLISMAITRVFLRACANTCAGEPDAIMAPLAPMSFSTSLRLSRFHLSHVIVVSPGFGVSAAICDGRCLGATSIANHEGPLARNCGWATIIHAAFFSIQGAFGVQKLPASLV